MDDQFDAHRVVPENLVAVHFDSHFQESFAFSRMLTSSFLSEPQKSASPAKHGTATTCGLEPSDNGEYIHIFIYNIQ